MNGYTMAKDGLDRGPELLAAVVDYQRDHALAPSHTPTFSTASPQVRGLKSEPPVGIEPTTYALRVRRSGQLS